MLNKDPLAPDWNLDQLLGFANLEREKAVGIFSDMNTHHEPTRKLTAYLDQYLNGERTDEMWHAFKFREHWMWALSHAAVARCGYSQEADDLQMLARGYEQLAKSVAFDMDIRDSNRPCYR